MITKFKLYESQRSDDALKLFFALMEKEDKTFFDIRCKKEFKYSELPDEYYEEFEILYFYYWPQGYALSLENYFTFSNEIVETPLNLLDKNYVKNQIKKYVKKSIIKKFNVNNNLYLELEQNKILQDRFKQFSNFYSVELNYILKVFRNTLKSIPEKIKSIRKFKI